MASVLDILFYQRELHYWNIVSCPCLFGSLLCSDRHHRIRNISDELGKISKLKDFEDVILVVDCGSMMRCDIIVLNRIDDNIDIIPHNPS